MLVQLSNANYNIILLVVGLRVFVKFLINVKPMKIICKALSSVW